MSAPRVSLAGIRARYAKEPLSLSGHILLSDAARADIPALLDLVDDARRLLTSPAMRRADARAFLAERDAWLAKIEATTQEGGT